MNTGKELLEIIEPEVQLGEQVTSHTSQET